MPVTRLADGTYVSGLKPNALPDAYTRRNSGQGVLGRSTAVSLPKNPLLDVVRGRRTERVPQTNTLVGPYTTGAPLSLYKPGGLLYKGPQLVENT